MNTNVQYLIKGNYEDLEAFREKWAADYSGRINSGKPLLLPRGLELSVVAMPANPFNQMAEPPLRAVPDFNDRSGGRYYQSYRAPFNMPSMFWYNVLNYTFLFLIIAVIVYGCYRIF